MYICIIYEQLHAYTKQLHFYIDVNLCADIHLLHIYVEIEKDMDGCTPLLSVGWSLQNAFCVESYFGYMLCTSSLVLHSCSKVTNHAASEAV